MKNLIIFILFLLANSNASAIKKTTDTVYVQCFKEKLSSKFYHSSKSTGDLLINFSFETNWTLYGNNRTSIMFTFYSNAIPNNQYGWFAKEIDVNTIRLFKNLYSLEQFTKALVNNKFSFSIANGKVHIVMLYGEKCSTKFEMYPVKVGTDLSSEG
jgi:NADH:ubiquinone oxidoreductase subunit